jgi:hypothetical protein
MADPPVPPRTSSKAPLFRARALEAIDSREGLDELMTIVPARSLYALVAVVAVLLAALGWGIFGRVPIVERGAGVVAATGGTRVVAALADGILPSDPLPIGTVVTRGTVVARLRTAALESSPLRAPIDGTIVDVRQRAGANVKRGDGIVTIEPAGATLHVAGFVDFRADPPIVPGMNARVTPVDDSGVAIAPIRGHVVFSAPEPATPARIASVLGNDAVAATLHGTLREVSVTLDGDAKAAAGNPCEIVLVVDEVSPLAFLFPRER